jgi:hypothetical protein
MELASRARDVDQRAASYYVLYRLAQLGYAASATAAGHTELMACTPDGGRVALLRVRSSGPNGRFDLAEADRRPSGRNVSYVFVDFASGAADPEVFILRPALVLAMLAMPPALVEQARRLLATNPAAALTVLRGHESEFPGGQLRLEREFLRVDALVRTGDHPAAEAGARALEARAPRSLCGERLQRILEGSH